MGRYFSGKRDISLQYSDSLNTSMNSPVISSYPGRPVSTSARERKMKISSQEVLNNANRPIKNRQSF